MPIKPHSNVDEIKDAIQKLGKELHSQYVLSFAPEDAAPGYHTLEVKVTRGRPFHIRARPGYWVGDAR